MKVVLFVMLLVAGCTLSASLTIQEEKKNEVQAGTSVRVVTDLEIAQFVIDRLLSTHKEIIISLETTIITSDVTVAQLVQLINTSLKTELIKIVGGKIQVDVVQLKTLVIERIVFQIQSSTTISAAVQAILIEIIRNEVDIISPIFDKIVAILNEIDVETIQMIIETARISIQPNQPVGQLVAVILEGTIRIVRTEVTRILIPVKVTVNKLFVNIENLLLLYYVSAEPSGEISKIITHTTNAIILKVVEIVGVVQYSTISILDILIEDDPNIVPVPIDEKELLNKLLAGFCKTMNLSLKNIAEGVLNGIAPRLGIMISATFEKVVNQLINILFPCKECWDIIKSYSII